MAQIKRKIPFGTMPAHWGLKGKLRDIAKAEWEFDGEDLEYRLLDINLAGYSEADISKKRLELDVKYRKITPEEAEIKLHELNSAGLSEKDSKLALLDIQKKYKHIDETEYEKARANILDEPYVRVAKIHTDPKNPAFGGIVLDWNESFIRYLEDNGYGPNPDPTTTVAHWFNDVCKNIALDAFDGQGDFTERMAPKEKDVIYRKDLEE